MMNAAFACFIKLWELLPSDTLRDEIFYPRHDR
jgi:hypothetical protein